MKGDGVDGTKDRTRVKWLSWWKRQQGKPKQKAEGLYTKSLTGLESGEKFVEELKSRRVYESKGRILSTCWVVKGAILVRLKSYV